MLKRFSISTKIFAGFGVLLVLLLDHSGIGIVGLYHRQG